MSGLFGGGSQPAPQKLPEPKVIRMPTETSTSALAKKRTAIDMARRKGAASTRMALRNTTGTSKLGSGGGGTGVG